MPNEPRIPGLRRSVHLPDQRIETDVDDEIAFHLESRVRALVSQGRTQHDARRTAEAEFGDLRASRRELTAVDRRRRRRERIEHSLETIAQDLRYAVRSLRRSPAFTITAVVTLVIGIGAAVAIFAIVNSVLLRPLPFKNPDRLVGAWHDFPLLGMTHGQQAAITYWTYQTQAHTIDGIGIYDESAANVAFDGSSAGAPQRVTTALFSASLFSVLGVSPTYGRVFTESEDLPGAAPVMLISYGMWRAQFGGDPKIIGRTLAVDDVRREIVGVMPPSFRLPTAETEIWIPLGLDRAKPPASAFGYTSIARLKPGVTVADAQRDFTAVLPRVVESFPNFVSGITTKMMMDQVRPRPVLNPLRDDITGGIAGTLWMMAGAAGLLLLVACANVANLTLVRADARQRELAVRAALGAGRSRIMRYYFSESAALASAAGLFGLAAAWIIVRILVARGPTDIPRLAEIAVDSRVVLFAVAITALAAAACSVIPALRMGRGSGSLALREGSRGGTAGRGQHRVRSALVAAQIALCLVVLAGSGLLVRSFEQLHAVRPGFDPEHVATLWMSLPRARYTSDIDVVRLYSTLMDRVAQLPGVKSVGATSWLPLASRGLNPNPLYPEEQPEYATKLPPLENFTMVGGEYFRAMAIPLLAGKLFDRMDTQREGDAIISSRTAEFFWKDPTGVAALGKRFRALPGGPWFTVVGVVGNTRDSTLDAPPSPTVFFPEVVQADAHIKKPARTMALVVRTTGEPTSIVPAVQRLVREIDPTLPTFDVRPMSEALRASTARLAFTILILAGAAVVTLTLGAVGLYGVMAYVVTLRRRELGIRIALGASPRGVAAATTRQGVALTSVGVAGGFVLFTVAARFMRTFLFGVAPWDPLTVAGATLTLFVVATLASWIPARRAGRVDPAEALRAE
jgi:predicted permease